MRIYLHLLLLLLARLAAAAEGDIEVDLLVTGLSWHSQPGYTWANPGGGIGVAKPLECGAEVFAAGMGYRDSERAPAGLLLWGARWGCSWACLDAAGGLQLRDGQLPAQGGLWSAGLHIGGGAWIHASYLPRALVGETAVAMLALRIRL